jgi:hypothetical protein
MGSLGERLIVSGLVAQPLGYDPTLAALGIDRSMHYRFAIWLRF